MARARLASLELALVVPVPLISKELALVVLEPLVSKAGMPKSLDNSDLPIDNSALLRLCHPLMQLHGPWFCIFLSVAWGWSDCLVVALGSAGDDDLLYEIVGDARIACVF